MATVGGLLADGVARLRAAGSETARLDAEVLLGAVLGADRTGLLAHPERDVPADATRRYEEALVRREAGEPVAYIRGLKEFFGLAFSVDRRALIPRPETERLVEAGLAAVMERLPGTDGAGARGPVRIVDVGTGSGAVAISLAVELRKRRVEPGRDVETVATDTSADALDLARENAVGHAVADAIEFLEADLLPPASASAGAEPGEPGSEDRFDVILANLPYVMSGAIAGLSIGASFEPRAALDGGADGLDIVRRLLVRLPGALTDRGVALVEIGADQGDSAPAAAHELLPGWRISVEADLAGLPRILRVAPGVAR
ncbi:MAG TPA: peptide chain release factor N(5)-glutamine methyltransferase [Candidatus Limnocylindrales bacterium]|nr:peptide chain release factor N(5)-glutamine methyltransferase [Candidatus Limnocylindrales bacterium]